MKLLLTIAVIFGLSMLFSISMVAIYSRKDNHKMMVLFDKFASSSFLLAESTVILALVLGAIGLQ